MKKLNLFVWFFFQPQKVAVNCSIYVLQTKYNGEYHSFSKYLKLNAILTENDKPMTVIMNICYSYNLQSIILQIKNGWGRLMNAWGDGWGLHIIHSGNPLIFQLYVFYFFFPLMWQKFHNMFHWFQYFYSVWKISLYIRKWESKHTIN